MLITNIIFILSILCIQADPNVYFYCAFDENAEGSLYIMTQKFGNKSKDVPFNFTDWKIFHTAPFNTSYWENYNNEYNDIKKYEDPNLRNLDDYIKFFKK